MKVQRHLAFWLAVLPLLFFACRKYSNKNTVEQTAIEKAMQYYNANKAIPEKETAGTKQKPLEPDWATAYETQSPDGSKSIIVSTEGFKLKDDSKLSVERFFAFREQDGQIIYGRIIEAFGNKDRIPDQKKSIVSSFEQNRIANFEGAILTYDINYKYIGGRIFRSGIQVEGYANLKKQNKSDKAQLQVASNSIKSKKRIAPTTRVNNEDGCVTWSRYLVFHFPDGTEIWQYLYSWEDCSGSSGSGGSGGSSSGGSEAIDGSDPGDLYVVSTSKDAINLADKLNCFTSLPNTGATYTMRICADVPVNSSPGILINSSLEPGHAFITLTKTVGGVTVTENFGFYPESGKASVFNLPVNSMVVNDAGHEYNASMLVNVTEAQFNAAIATALSEKNKKYDLNGYNCTDFALAVFNSAVPSADQLSVPDWQVSPLKNYGRTPNGLHLALNARSLSDSRASVSTANSSNSTICP